MWFALLYLNNPIIDQDEIIKSPIHPTSRPSCYISPSRNLFARLCKGHHEGGGQGQCDDSRQPVGLCLRLRKSPDESRDMWSKPNVLRCGNVVDPHRGDKIHQDWYAWIWPSGKLCPCCKVWLINIVQSDHSGYGGKQRFYNLAGGMGIGKLFWQSKYSMP
jgi:hypothetical protein